MKVKVQLGYGYKSEDGDAMTMILDEEGRQLGYFYSDTLRANGLPSVGKNKKLLTAWIEVQS